MTGKFQCLGCGHTFEHTWTGGTDLNNPKTFAATDCPECEYVYVKRLS